MEASALKERRDQALAFHRAGRLAEAKAIYLELLEAEPHNADFIGLLAMAQFQAGDVHDATRLWWRSLDGDSPAPIMLRNVNNLMVTLRERRERKALKRLADLPLPDWPKDLAPDRVDRNTVLSLAGAISDMGRKEIALRLLKSLLPHLPGDPELASAAAALMLQLGHACEAHELLASLSDADRRREPVLILRAAAAFAAGNDEDARRAARDFIEAAPVYLTERRQTQSMLIGIVNRAPSKIERATATIAVHFSSNTPDLLAKDFAHRYRFLSIYPEAESVKAALTGLPRPDLIINNWVNAESLSTPGTLDRLARFVDELGPPILNHPSNAVLVTRQRNAERLADIPNAIVPRVRRLVNDAAWREELVRYIETEFEYPVLVRTPFAQKGKRLWRSRSRNELFDALDRIGPQQFYAIQYVDNPTGKGSYRKIRAAVVGERIFITHAHFSKGWCVHRPDEEEQAELAERDPDIREYRMQVVAEPEATLGVDAMQALKELRSRIPLELFGIDFDITPKGRVLFFEANASMRISFAGKARSAAEDRRREEAAAALDALFRAAVLREITSAERRMH